MLIVDSQIHIWRNGRMSPVHRPVSTYTAGEALAEMKEAGVDCAVLHPPTNMGEAANALAVEAVLAHPDRFCILGHFDLASPDRETILARWRERPGMLGFRYSFRDGDESRALTDGSLDWFWQAAGRAGLVVGLRVIGDGIQRLGEVARRYPGLKLHIDHIGRAGTGRDDAVYADLGEMLALARLPNVGVKLSGAPSTSSQPYPYRNIHDYLKRTVDAFGPERCFWGADISRMPCSYRQCVTMFTEEMPWLKGRDLELVMGEAFVKWLGWRRPAA